jgi:phosphotransferase system HPr-like phosphotransfer protein
MSQEATKMKTINVSLFSNTDVKDFVNIVSRYDFDIDLVSGRYVVDAKSIMGIFSLDLTKPICVNFYTEDADGIMAELKPYTVE